jgi:hypothetical protein
LDFHGLLPPESELLSMARGQTQAQHQSFCNVKTRVTPKLAPSL